MEFSQQDYEILEKNTVYHGVFSLSRLSLRHRLFRNGEWSQAISYELFERD